MEKVQTAPAQADGDVDVRRLPHLISGARASSGADRVALAGSINAVLIAMRGPGHAEDETRVIVAALDARQLDLLVDAEGRSCRKEAVETLLASGFPHALNIGPDDLAFARAYRGPTQSNDHSGGEQVGKARTNGAWVVALAQLLFALIFFSSGAAVGPGALTALLSGMAGLVLAVGFARTNPPLSEQTKWGTGLGAIGLVQLLSALAVGPPALIGGLGVLFGTLVAFALS